MEVFCELDHCVGYKPTLNGLQIHPNGKDYISILGGAIAVSKLEDINSQEFLRGHDDTITAFAMSSTGKFLASGQRGENADCVVWDYETRTPIYRLSEHDYHIRCVSFSEDERLLLTCGGDKDNKLFIWDMATGHVVSSAPLQPTPVNCCAMGGFIYDPKGNKTEYCRFATGGNGIVILWSINVFTGQISQQKMETRSNNRNYTCLYFSQNGRYLYAGTGSGDFFVFNANECIFQNSVNVCRQGVLSMVLLPGGDVLTGGGDGSVMRFRSLDDGLHFEDCNSLQLPGGPVCNLCSDAYGTMSLAGCANGFLCHVNLDSFQGSCIQESHFDKVVSVRHCRSNSDIFATMSIDNTIRVWNADNYSVALKIPTKGYGEAMCLVFHESFLLTGWSDGVIRAFDVVDGRLLWELPDAHVGGISSMEITFDEKLLITGGIRGEVRAWNLASRRMVCHLKEHSKEVTAIAPFSDNTHVLTCSKDKSMLCWNIRDEKRVASLSQGMGGVNSVVLSRSEDLVISAGQDRKISFWTLRDTNPIRTLSPPGGGETTCLAVSHDGQLLASGGSDMNFKVWRMDNYELVFDSQGHSGRIRSVSFTPDDRQVMSVGDDGNIFIWNIYKR
eukprot:TRINITY_DN2617_c0_g1_i1.p1 TRINITY_DN2617_c0_g1~~TRINITY_DN2617_c0_g1_i1.p1  ORF type:complete len:615 (-),score=172.48 TRINITY_DN2617_c0_g1_i1:90-1934(-)